jgi:uncharacterized protein
MTATAEQPTDLTRWLKMVEALSHAPDWPTEELPLEVKQTHISVVLLGQRRALKLKKPVNFGFLDYTTLEKRLRACEAEINLNRRLCPDIYLGIGGVIEVDGQIRLAGRHGQIVDYGVWMKRLPADRMLDELVRQNSVSEAMIDRVAARLAAFHRSARRGADVDVYGCPAEIRHNWEENFTQTESVVDRTISAADFAAIRHWVTAWLNREDDLLRARVQAGWVRDGHGDVRCESVCVTDQIYIYDCIEFNERFRCNDVASEVAFLAMDLAALGRPDLGYYFGARYQAQTGDAQLFKLLPFYCCYRAYVRGKVLSFRLAEAEFDAAAKADAAARAKHYFELARRYATPLREPTMVVVAGLSGTGKTALARAIAAELGLRVVSADAVRQALFGAAKHPTEYGAGAYTPKANRRTYQALIERGCEILKEERGVVLEATFRRATDRVAACALAAASGAQFRLIECRLAEALVQQRLEERAARQDGLSDANWEVYQRQRGEFEPVTDMSPTTHLVLDTSARLVTVGRTATDWLRRVDGSIK